MTALLELDGVKKSFGGLHAVDDVSFAVERGEILGLIGPNGAGKTTLFNLINGVYTPDAGRIVFDGTDIAGEKPYRIARYGLARAHQIVQPLANMTVLENCMVGACFGRENLPLARANATDDADHVLDFGEKLAEGLPGEVSRDPHVIEAYLGDPKVAAELQRGS